MIDHREEDWYLKNQVSQGSTDSESTVRKVTQTALGEGLAINVLSNSGDVEAMREYCEMLKPTYNNYNAKGRNVERQKETTKKLCQSEKYMESQKKYFQTEKGKEVLKKSRNKYFHTEKGKKALRKYQKKYYSQLCEYNGETLTLKALISRFSKEGIVHPTQEARKYLKK